MIAQTHAVPLVCIENPHKLKLSHHPGRAHGFPLRARPSARQKSNSHSQTHFHTNQNEALVKNPIFKLRKHMKRVFQILPDIRLTLLLVKPSFKSQLWMNLT